MAEPEGRRPKRVSDIAGAVLAALLAFTAVPAVLLSAVGDPLAGGLGHTWQPVPLAALCVLALAAWLAWIACCAQLVRAVVTHVRRGGVTGASTSVVDRLAARIAVGVLAVTSFGAPVALSGAAGATVLSSGPATTAGATRVTSVHTPGAAVQTATAYVVGPGDSLRSIAEAVLEDGADWPAIAALNLGRVLPGGETFVDPDQLREGWRLRLPPGADGTRHRVPVSRRSQSDLGAARRPDRLPELMALGLGSLACAGLARRARRRQRPDPFSGDLGPTLSEATVDVASLVGRFEGTPALRSFEVANCMLGRSVLGLPVTPVVRAVCVSASGVTFWLATAVTEAPEGFEPMMDGAAWHVGHATLCSEPASPYVPLALPVGDDAEGSWLVALGPGDVLPVLGESADSLVRSVRSALRVWAWADTIVVTDDPHHPRLAAEVVADPLSAPHVLFVGDPASLPPGAGRFVAVITRAPVAASDLTLLVDRRGATLHPMGRVVRPHLQSREMARHVDELLAPPEQPASKRAGARARPAHRPASGTEPGRTALAPGTVDVRLLAMTPRLDGLREELPPNRARRAVELVAYLALHHPNVITGERLRTRVLGNSDADAAAKTLFNTAHAARRAMGLDRDGNPLFPSGSRNGLYQVSPEVTVDVHRAAALALEGKAHRDPAAAIAHLRAALDLVEGEPLANALAGYSWWEAEGHGGRVAAVLVDAACSMARLASAAELFDLARWGLERARIVEPYSEALSRAAMEVAAAEGDAERLRLEWRDCQRRVDLLDPGSSPSSLTESLYGELRSRVALAPQQGATRASYVPIAGD